MRDMVEGRVERPNCSKPNNVMKEPISEPLARKRGKAQEKVEKTYGTDAVSSFLSRPFL